MYVCIAQPHNVDLAKDDVSTIHSRNPLVSLQLRLILRYGQLSQLVLRHIGKIEMDYRVSK